MVGACQREGCIRTSGGKSSSRRCGRRSGRYSSLLAWGSRMGGVMHHTPRRSTGSGVSRSTGRGAGSPPREAGGAWQSGRNTASLGTSSFHSFPTDLVSSTRPLHGRVVVVVACNSTQSKVLPLPLHNGVLSCHTCLTHVNPYQHPRILKRTSCISCPTIASGVPPCLYLSPLTRSILSSQTVCSWVRKTCPADSLAAMPHRRQPARSSQTLLPLTSPSMLP